MLFAASAALTVRLMRPAPAAGGMAMPESPVAAAVAFTGTWVVMMLAMMLPSLVPMLSSYRRVAGRWRRGLRTALVGVGYFAVWAGIGIAAYVGTRLAAGAAARWSGLGRPAPFAAGVVCLGAGLLQLTPWKLRQLGRCRLPVCGRTPGRAAAGALAHGARAGAYCAQCCAGYMLVLIVAGVMDLRLMALVAGAITAERVLPWPAAAARAGGIIAVAAGALRIAHVLLVV